MKGNNKKVHILNVEALTIEETSGKSVYPVINVGKKELYSFINMKLKFLLIQLKDISCSSIITR